MISHTWLVGYATGLMVVSALPTFFLAVFAPQLMFGFGIGHAQLGMLVSLIYASATVLAHKGGDLVDRRGAILGGQLLLLAGAVTMVILVLSPNFLLLLPASVLAGLALAVSNPVTNVAVRQGLSGRRLRSAMGIKQGGVPLAAVLAGGVLPSLAVWISWRGVAVALAIVTFIGLLPWTRASRRLGARETPVSAARAAVPGLTPALRLLGRYALVMGCLAGLVNTFHVLFVVDELQWSAVQAGWIAALLGTSGAVARWLWVEFAGRTSRLSPVILLMTGLGCLGTATMVAAQYALAPLAWIGAVLLGASVMGWQGFVMHTVATNAAPTAIGEESGRVMQQFYLGLLLTPFTVGWAIEQSGSYAVLWISQSALLAVAMVPAVLLLRQE